MLLICRAFFYYGFIPVYSVSAILSVHKMTGELSETIIIEGQAGICCKICSDSQLAVKGIWL